jgi:hypothetical protein
MLAVIVTNLLTCHFRVDFGPNKNNKKTRKLNKIRHKVVVRIRHEKRERHTLAI